MLVELAVANLGVIEQVTIELPPGLLALTGETGAGKTLLVDAISLLMGGRADPGLVRPGASEATVDGRFEVGDEELVLTRVIPATGRSRAYVNGRPATAGALAELGERLVDLHGQHQHQSLLGVGAQRAALDRFGDVDRSRLDAAKAAVAEIDAALAELGGDPRARAREIDLLRYQVDELDAAGIDDPDEDARLDAEEDDLANAVSYQEVGAAALEALSGDDGILDRLAGLLHDLDGARPLAEQAVRVRGLLAEAGDLADEVRAVADGLESDPERLEAVQSRRHLIKQLTRKYGETLAEVMDEHRELAERLAELEAHDERAASLDAERDAADAELATARAEVREARLKAAPALAAEIEAKLPALAMPKARIGIEVEGDDGSEVSLQLSANPGSPLQALSKVASGGELARTMLALRSVLSEAPPILVFDEVDAGIGGEAGHAVGAALKALGDRHQVLVVTHLPQVAAFADAHLHVRKQQKDDETVSEVHLLTRDERVTELARMLSGKADSGSARSHAEELLAEGDSLS